MLEINNKTSKLSCNTQIDYSEVRGDKILPFLIELDLKNSILYPSKDQNQRFCYIITGIGDTSCEFANLSHIVLGICSKITQEQILNISVVRNNKNQKVVFGSGGNVEIISLDSGKKNKFQGLKFDFDLDKINGVMTICFELTKQYSVCSNTVYLYGQGITVKGLSICGPGCDELSTCTTIAYQSASVCLPVTVKPFANAGAPVVHCYGDPIITPRMSKCDGDVNENCTFTITQNICISVPIEFGANTIVGQPSISCGNVSCEDKYKNCTTTDQDICTHCHSRNLKIIHNNK